MLKIAIVLIHNHNPERLRNALTVIDNIRFELNAVEIFTDRFEISQQPGVLPISRLLFLRLKILESALQVRYFCNYLKLPFRYWLPYIVLGFFLSFFSILASPQKRKSRKIESIITGKHFQSWQIGRDYDFLIVLEDDILQTGPLDEFIRTVQEIASLNPAFPIYIDLAGGYSQSVINNKTYDLLSHEPGKFYTNTACGYITNKYLTNYLIRYYDSHDLTSKIGIDFFLNAAFSSSKMDLGFCFHLQKGGLSHGSFRGVFKSWTDEN